MDALFKGNPQKILHGPSVSLLAFDKMYEKLKSNYCIKCDCASFRINDFIVHFVMGIIEQTD